MTYRKRQHDERYIRSEIVIVGLNQELTESRDLSAMT
jgi:hypothetical protein